ncbi:MAG TPA: hypothetical protein PKL83_02085 [bacterium]|nr:hypothetical protein [bacterium]
MGENNPALDAVSNDLDANVRSVVLTYLRQALAAGVSADGFLSGGGRIEEGEIRFLQERFGGSLICTKKGKWRWEWTSVNVMSLAAALNIAGVQTVQEQRIVAEVVATDTDTPPADTSTDRQENSRVSLE